MASISLLWQGLKGRPARLSFFLISVLFVMLCLFFVPRWEQNDDVCMSMIAHGYGLAAYGSPNLVYSNVLWGYLVRAIPPVNGILGYSLATMAVLLLAGWAMLYFLFRLGVEYLPGFLAVILVMAQPILFPQFTLNAGLLTVSAVIGWRAHAQLKDLSSLWIACLLAFTGFLIRAQEFFLVLAVALPFLPWRALWRYRSLQIAVVGMALAIMAASALDRWAYGGPEWKFFRELNVARMPLCDFDAGKYLKKRSDILVRHGFSKNDIDLISSKFFIDTAMANPQTLNAMMDELGPLFMQKGRIEAGFEALKELNSSMLVPLILAGLFLLGVMPRKSVVFSWAICLAALFSIGVLFRPGVLHVYFPLMSLLVVAPLFLGPTKGAVRYWMILAVLLVACAVNAYALIPQSAFSKRVMERAQKDAAYFPPETLFSWGGTFPVQLIFPVLSNDAQLRKIRWYSMNIFTHAPFSVATADEKTGHGFLDRWRTEKGIPIIQSSATLMLDTYCQEREHGRLQGAATRPMPIITVQRIRCVTTQ